jgi:hypothetical protein
MNISKLALIALLGSALTAFGCSEDSEGPGGSGGSGGGGGAIDPLCQPVAGECTSGAIADVARCAPCELTAPPDVADACAPDASTDNPDSCSSLGTGGAGGGNDTVTYQLTFMQAAEDCNKGFNLDDCNGETCKASEATLSSPDGADGVDNGLSSLQPALVEIDATLTNVNQAFYDSLCGITNNPTAGVCEGGTAPGDPCFLTCVGGSDDGVPCIDDTGCTDVMGTCSTTVATTCLANTDCPSGETCENADVGTCSTDVADDACPNGADVACPAGDTTCTCSGTTTACTTDANCTAAPATCVLTDEGTCNLDNDDCSAPIPPADIQFIVDANADEDCATVTVVSTGVCDDPDPTDPFCEEDSDCGTGTCLGGGTTTSILNLVSSDPTDPTSPSCLSGKLEPIPALLLTIPGAFGNPSVRMTVSSGGFSHGVLGATIDEEFAKIIAVSISEEAVLVIPLAFDISETLTQDTSAACNALSMGLEMGGVTVVPN